MDVHVGFGGDAGGAPGVPEPTPLERVTAERDKLVSVLRDISAGVETLIASAQSARLGVVIVGQAELGLVHGMVIAARNFAPPPERGDG